MLNHIHSINRQSKKHQISRISIKNKNHQNQSKQQQFGSERICFFAGMSHSCLTAQQLQEQYGQLLAEPRFQQCSTGYLLAQALMQNQPPIRVSAKAASVWLSKHRLPEDARVIDNAEDLEQEYGESIRHLSVEYPTAYKLSRALREREPPVCITDKVAQGWLQKYARHGELQRIENSGHLEMRYGDRIRSDGPADADADVLTSWLLKELAVSAPRKVCQTWLSKTWSSSGRICTVDAL